jgi:hypothetical protein
MKPVKHAFTMILKGYCRGAAKRAENVVTGETGEMGREFDPSRKMKYFFCISI